MKKLSFILPVYNVEPYLEKCIKSIRDKDMSYDEYEIIVVNDGSPDNSEAIVRKLQKEVSNILLINQENAGVSVARNVGIKNASGEYIIFIDPDDYVKPNLLKKLYDRAKKQDLDILLCGRSIVKANGTIINKTGYGEIEQKIFDGVSAFYEKDKPYPVFDSSVGRLYKTSIIKNNNLNFPIGVVHLEDGVFVREVFTLSKRVGFENVDFYQVFERIGSASRSNVSVSKSAAIGDVKSAKYLVSFKKSYQLNSKQLGLINESIIKYTLLPLMRAVKAKNFKSLISFNRLLTDEDLKPIKVEHVSKSIYLELAKAYNQSLWYFVVKYIVKKKRQNLKSQNLKKQEYNNAF